MRVLPPLAFALLLSGAAQAADKRQLDAHEHGHGRLDIAVEGNAVAMALEVPGADIVGFEHAAETDADKAAMAEGKARLMQPLTLFVTPAAAGCTVTAVDVEYETEGHDQEHGKDHHDDDHDKDAKTGDADHKHHDDEGEGHGAFHAEYALACTDPSALTRIEFRYFQVFPGAEELDVQVITDKGQGAHEVTREAPVLDLAGMI